MPLALRAAHPSAPARRVVWFAATLCVCFTAAALTGRRTAAEAQSPAEQRAVASALTAATVGGRNSEIRPTGGTAVVLGQVVDAATGRPIPEATVSISGRSAGAARGAQQSANLQLLTDTEGRFVVHDLPPTTLVINASASGYLGGGVGQMRPSGLSVPLEVVDGARLNDVRIRLWKFAAVSGIVVDENGDPAVNTSVRVFRRVFIEGAARYLPAGAAKTDDRGVYRISGLQPGDYGVAIPQVLTTTPGAVVDNLVSNLASGLGAGSMLDLMSSGVRPNADGTRVGALTVSAESAVPPPPAADGRFRAYQTLFYPNAVSLAQASAVTLESGDERLGIDFQLRLIPTVSVSGAVIAPASTGNIAVRLLATGADDRGTDPGVEVATASSLADGTFTFLGVPPGQYLAMVEKRARQPISAELASNPLMQIALGNVGATSSAALYGQALIGVGTSDVTGVSIALHEGRFVSGHVVFAAGAAQPTPEQIQAITFTLVPVTRNGSATAPPARVDSNGDFKVGPYGPGRYFLTAAGVPQPWSLQSAIKDGRNIALDPVDVKDAEIAGVTVTFGRAAQVSGVVRQPSGSPFVPSRVFVFPADVRTWIENGMSARRMREIPITQAAGTYTVGALVPGDYAVAVSSDVNLTDTQNPALFTALSRVATRVTVAEGDRKTVDLQLVAGGAPR